MSYLCDIYERSYQSSTPEQERIQPWAWMESAPERESNSAVDCFAVIYIILYLDCKIVATRMINLLYVYK